MTPRRKPPAPAHRLRLRAEQRLAKTPREVARMPAEDVQKLVHELQVHQIELEMQNEELRHTQLELETARERLLLPYDAAPVGFLTLDAQGIIREANLAAARLLNLDRVNLTGQKLARFIAPESQAAFSLHQRQLFSTEAKQTCELHVLRTGGAPFSARLESVVERARPEPVARCLVVMSDITEHKLAEALRRSEHHLSNFFHQAPIGLVWLSASGIVLRANQAQLDLMGCPAAHYEGHSFLEFCAEPTQGRELLARLAAKETVRNLRLAQRCKDGAVRHLLVDAISTWSDHRFEYSSIFLRDITDRLQLEQELLHISEQEHRRIAQDLHDGLGQLLVGAAYLAGTVRQDLAAKSRREARPLRRIWEVINEALALTRSLARGLHPVEAEPYGLMAALEALAARTGKLFHLRCQFHCRRPVLVPDNTVATHLFRIAQEAVTNAVRHAKPRRIHIRLAATRNRLQLAIRDDGSGMPDRPQSPLGLGLRIMRHRAGIIGGSLVIHKASSGGTTVACTVNLAAPSVRKRNPKTIQPQCLSKD